jgi:hypothetical protein
MNYLAIDIGKKNLGWCIYSNAVNVDNDDNVLNSDDNVDVDNTVNDINISNNDINIPDDNHIHGIIINYGLYDISEHIDKKDVKQHGTVVARNRVLVNWLNNLIDEHNINKLIVEKQVISNVTAKSLESCIMTVALMKNIECVIYDPKNKFKYLNPTYNSKKKEHKVIATNYALSILKYHEASTNEFNLLPKKDDVSDAICMAFMTYYEDNNKGVDIKKYLIYNDN